MRSRDDATPRAPSAVPKPWGRSEQPCKHRGPECVLPAWARARRPGQLAGQWPWVTPAPLAKARQEGYREPLQVLAKH